MQRSIQLLQKQLSSGMQARCHQFGLYHDFTRVPACCRGSLEVEEHDVLPLWALAAHLQMSEIMALLEVRIGGMSVATAAAMQTRVMLA